MEEEVLGCGGKERGGVLGGRRGTGVLVKGGLRGYG